MSIIYCDKHDRHYDSDFTECAECEDEQAELDEIQEDTTSMEEKFDELTNRKEWQPLLDKIHVEKTQVQ